MFEYQGKNIHIRFRALTVLIWVILAVSALFGAYPATVLNGVALLDLTLIVVGETIFAFTHLTGRRRAVVLVRHVVVIGAVATVFLFIGTHYLWLAVLSIRYGVNVISRRLLLPPKSEIDKRTEAAADYDDGDLSWVGPVLIEARKQVQWRAVAALYKIDRPAIDGIIANIFDKAPAESNKSAIAAKIISMPVLLSSYISMRTMPLTGSLDEWLAAVWEYTKGTAVAVPTRASSVAHALALSRRYLQDLPSEIHGSLLDDEARDRRSEALDLEGLKRRAENRFDRYGTIGPWTLYQLGLAQARLEDDRGFSNQHLLSATNLAERLLAGDIKVLSKLSPLPGMNPEFDDKMGDTLSDEADRLSLTRVCIDCRLRLAESFNEHGMVDEARRNIVTALECLLTAPHGGAGIPDVHVERVLDCLFSVRAWTGEWRGLEMLLPPLDDETPPAEVVKTLAVRALDRWSSGDHTAAREALTTCCETLSDMEDISDVDWEFVYAAVSPAVYSGAFNEADYLLRRWLGAAKPDNWNNREREVNAVNLVMLIKGRDESVDLVPYAVDLLSTMHEVTADGARSLTQGELLGWLERSHHLVSSALTVLLNWPDEPPREELVERAVLLLGSLRSTSLNALRFRRQLVRSVDHEGLTDLFASRGAIASDLASYEFQSRTHSKRDLGERLMRDRRSVFDVMLARYFAQYEAQELSYAPKGGEEIQAVIADDEAFILCFRYIGVDPYADDGIKAQYYGAAVFRRNAPMQLARLGEINAIDRAIDRLFGAITDGEPTWERQADALSDLLAPLLDLLGGITNWVICPAGKLNNAPFCLLKFDSGRVIDSVNVRFVSTLSELFPPITGEKTASSPPLVLGNPDYALYDPDEATVKLMSEYSTPESHEAKLKAEAVPGHAHFKPLDETEAEAQEVAELLGVDAHTGKDARESLLKSVASPRILHLATHGYWVTGEDGNNLEYADALKDEFESSGYAHPLARSGVALAGANWFVDSRTIADQGDDGLLNGYDVLELDMTGTELVVLSACRTGESDSLGIAGALGLRFAFAAAGARSQLTTLWPVGDRVTRIFMNTFYDELVNKKARRSQAIHRAQEAIRATPKYQHPFFWAAFVLYGDDEQLF